MPSDLILVTGAGGYIGGQVGLELKDHGYQVVGIDRRDRPVSQNWHTIQDGFTSKEALTWITRNQPRAIVHCAGTSLVGPSMEDPGEYYRNNVGRTIKLLEHVRNYSPNTRVIFASSAATYGEPDAALMPLKETAPTNPISPYGHSKLMVEQILADYHRAYNLGYVAYRFFNVCGADPKGRHGQESAATHIIARVCESLKDGKKFRLNGDDYATPDGTCIRDYVHVADIASAIRFAIANPNMNGVFNIGTSSGLSNREIMTASERITGKTLDWETGPRRSGDPDRLTADPSELNNLGWSAGFDLDDMIQHAWAWYVR